MENNWNFDEIDLQIRKTTIFLRSELSADIMNPEGVRIRLNINNNSVLVDLGSLCYTKRERMLCNARKIQGKADRVVVSSFHEDRIELIRTLIDYVLVSGNKDKTIKNELTYFIKCADWCDSNKHESFWKTTAAFTTAYKHFSDKMYSSVVSLSLSRNNASYKQRFFRKFARLLFGERMASAIARSAPVIHQEPRRLEAPEEELVAEHIEIYLRLSKQISNFLINKNPYPLKLNMKGYSTYVFYTNGRNVRTPYIDDGNFHHVFNFSEGRLSTIEEHQKLAKNATRSSSARAVSDAKQSLDACNKNSHHSNRLALATLALRAYASLFIWVTGSNPSQFIEFEYEEAIELVNSPWKKELTGIKQRASGKKVRFPIGGVHGIRILKEYLQFREWVLDGQECKWLFIGLARRGSYTGKPVQLDPTFQSKFFTKRLRGVYLPKDYKNVPPSGSRKFKSITMHTLGIDPLVVAGVMGHKLSTNLKHYTEPTATQMKSEFSAFTDSINSAALKVKIRKENHGSGEIPTVTGHCDKKGTPSTLHPTSPIQPSCETQYGCLNCTHYICHADEEDIWKLLSLKYVMTEVRRQSEEIEHVDSFLIEFCNRIDQILKNMANLSLEMRKMILEINRKVFELGFVTPFWETRLVRYQQLGVIL